MIRIECKKVGDQVETKWVDETKDRSSACGRLMLSVRDFDRLVFSLSPYENEFRFVDKGMLP